MNTDKISYLIEAVESGTFSRAAEKFGLTQSGLNRQISSLEAELKTTLLARGKKGVRLARGTEQIYQRLKSIRKLEQLLMNEISDFHGKLVGELVIGAYYSVAASWLPQVLNEFAAEHPQIKIEIVEGVNKDFEEKLHAGLLDCAFVDAPPKGFDWYPLIDTEYVAWIPADHPLAAKETLTPQELIQEPMIYPQMHKDTDIDRFLEVKRLKPKVRFATHNPNTAFAMVSSGLGVSLNNRLQSESMKGSAVVKSFTPAEPLQLGITLPPIESASPAMLAFLNLAQKHKVVLYGKNQ